MDWRYFTRATATLTLAVILVSCAGQTKPAPTPSPAREESGQRGTLLLHGGDDLGPEFVSSLVHAIRPDGDLCLISTANEQATPWDPDPSRMFELFSRAGARVRHAYYLTAADAENPAKAALLADCGGFFFDGGLPKLLSQAFLVGHNGKVEPSLALKTILRRFEQAGAPLGGSSAGAMIMGPVSECTCQFGASPNALAGHFEEVPGFGVLPVPIDAHGLVYAHYGRDMVAMRYNHWPLMISIDRSTGLEIPPDGSPWRVLDGTPADSPRGMLGGGAVMILHSVEPAPHGTLEGFDLTLIGHGDLYDRDHDKPIPSPARIAETRPHQGEAMRSFIFANDEFEYGLHLIAAGKAAVAGWDPQTATRTRIAWTADSIAYEGGNGAPLLTHLALAIDRLTPADLPPHPWVGYAREDWDWSIGPIAGPRAGEEDKTPVEGPGVRTIATARLAELLDRPDRPILIDVLPPAPNSQTPGLANSVWLPRSGWPGSAGDADENELVKQLKQITGGDKDRPMVFYCLDSAHGWSYNAAQRAVHLGYRNVLWYRGGIHSWQASGRRTQAMVVH